MTSLAETLSRYTREGELYERIDADLERLRAQGLILPLTAKGYCGEWRSAGFWTAGSIPNHG